MMETLAVMVVAVAFCRAGATDWKDGDNGLVRWGEYCDFSGGDIEQHEIGGELCGKRCLDSDQCTHFTWQPDGRCLLKKTAQAFWIARENLAEHSVCGWVTAEGFAMRAGRRARTVWRDGDGGRVKWAEYCDFPGGDIARLDDVAGEVCGRKCLDERRCTHFTWLAERVCVLKTSARQSWAAQENLKDYSVCGWVVGHPGIKEDEPPYDMSCLCSYKHVLTNAADGGIVKLRWNRGGEHSQAGQVKWAEDCDFVGYDLKNGEFRNEVADNCPKLCLARKDCTNFTFKKTTKRCYLKKIPPADPVPLAGSTGAVCGYVRSRYSPQFPESGPGSPEWHCTCTPVSL